MASLQNTTYSQNTTVASSSPNVVRLPITSSVNTGLTNLNNLVYVTNQNVSGRLGDAIQVYYSGGPGFIIYETYGP
jgi:hypothetical protein